MESCDFNGVLANAFGSTVYLLRTGRWGASGLERQQQATAIANHRAFIVNSITIKLNGMGHTDHRFKPRYWKGFKPVGEKGRPPKKMSVQSLILSVMINPDCDNPDAPLKPLFASVVSTSGYAMCVTKDDSIGVVQEGMRRKTSGEYVLQAQGVASQPGAYFYHHMLMIQVKTSITRDHASGQEVPCVSQSRTIAFVLSLTMDNL